MAKRRRRMTAARRRQIRMAQRASARKRKIRAKDTFGYWVAKGVRKVANKATLGLSGMLTQPRQTVSAKKTSKRIIRKIIPG